MKMITPMQLYHAARETCLRLYAANGGDPSAQWSIQPYPGTAAIACRTLSNGKLQFDLAMPAFPLNVRLPRWKGDLIAAYTVHELLHALWTDWSVVTVSKRDSLHSLVNAIEDNRIEAKASRGDLVSVSEARRLLEALNAYIVARAFKAPHFKMNDAKQFAFVLNMVIFAEKLGYQSDLPIDWRAHVDQAFIPLFDHALAQFDGLQSTHDVLQLARYLKAMADKLSKPAPQKPAQQPTPVASKAGQDDADDAGKAGEDDADDAGEAGEDDANDASKASEPDANSADKADDTDSHATSPDITDTTQDYAEANLNELAQEAVQEAGVTENEAIAQAVHAATAIEAPSLCPVDCENGGDPKLAGAAISSPAKLRRHLTLAVKAPERIGVKHRQSSGRLDMRNLAGIASGSGTIFRRRVEDDGMEAAVTLLVDVSSSMKGPNIRAAKALAIHMGDALKAAGVKFEISAFNDSLLLTPKPFNKAWNNDTQRAVAGLRANGGTSMLPALRDCAARLLTVGNVSRRILLALTDGEDGYAPEANSALCAFYAAKGVEIVGIGLYVSSVKAVFNGRAITVSDCDKLSEMGLGELVKVLGAPTTHNA
jgi:Cobalamin biosynthesis protein CobT VWA domain